MASELLTASLRRPRKEIELSKCSSLIWYTKPTVYKERQGNDRGDLMIRKLTTANEKRGSIGLRLQSLHAQFSWADAHDRRTSHYELARVDKAIVSGAKLIPSS